MSYSIHTLDLKFQGAPGAIASFLIRTGKENILVETGPHSCFEQLKSELSVHKLKATDISRVFLTHIHFDHAGAAWNLAKLGSDIYVHPAGYKHLLNPQRLYNSAAQIYGDQMHNLWGDMENIDEHRLHAVADKVEILLDGRGLKMRAYHTPGHAKHHIAWLFDGNLFTGDVAGIKIEDGPVLPPCPPPDIDLVAWLNSIDLLRQLDVDYLWLSHFGVYENSDTHWNELESSLKDWFEWMNRHSESAADTDKLEREFDDYVNTKYLNNLNQQVSEAYSLANPAWMSVVGILRALSKM